MNIVVCVCGPCLVVVFDFVCILVIGGVFGRCGLSIVKIVSQSSGTARGALKPWKPGDGVVLAVSRVSRRLEHVIL